MALESPRQLFTQAKPSVSEQAPIVTENKVSDDKAQCFTRTLNTPPKLNVTSAPETSPKKIVPELVSVSPAQSQVLNKQVQIYASVTTAKSSNITVSTTESSAIAVAQEPQSDKQNVVEFTSISTWVFLKPELLSAFSAQSLFGNSHSRNIPISGRTQFRFQDISPRRNNDELVELVTALERGGLTLKGLLSEAVKPIIQAVLDELVQAAGISGLNPELIIRDSWTLHAAYSVYNTINITTRSLLVYKSLGGLAHVLAHELGHILAAHEAEAAETARYSECLSRSLQSKKRWCCELGNIGEMMYASETLDMDTPQKKYYALSRLGEYEADYIGMFLIAKAGFDPREALAICREEMQNEEDVIKKGIEIEHTHPKFQNRITILESQLDAAMALYEGSDSKGILGAPFEEMRRILQKELDGLVKARKRVG